MSNHRRFFSDNKLPQSQFNQPIYHQGTFFGGNQRQREIPTNYIRENYGHAPRMAQNNTRFLTNNNQTQCMQDGMELKPIASHISSTPLYNTLYSQTQTLLNVVNNDVDHEISLFGYKQNSLRFGGVEHFNTNYSSTQNKNTVTEKSLEIVSQSNINSSMIEGFSEIPSEFDLQLGQIENPYNHLSLVNSPNDTITRMKFSKSNSDLLAVSSWDGSVKMWKISASTNNSIFNFTVNVSGCVFDLDWTVDDRLLMAHSDGNVSILDVTTRTARIIGRHTGPVKSIRSADSRNFNLVLTGSYDGVVRLWDLRTNACVCAVNANGKVFSLAYHKNCFAFINHQKEFYAYNIENPPTLRLRRGLENKFPLRTLTLDSFNPIKPSEMVGVVSTTDGRIFVISLTPHMRDYSFKSNRNSLNPTQQHAYPIHDVILHPKSKTLACCGGDGVINIWDIYNKKPVHSFNQMPLPVTSMSYNYEGDAMAYAIGYDWSRGVTGYKYKTMKPRIYIRHCKEEFNYPPPVMHQL